MRRSDKINFIRDRIYPLLTYIDPNSSEPEKYIWEDGDETIKIVKDFIPSDRYPSSGLMEIYACIYGRRSKGLGTFIYQLPYDKGTVDFIDIDDWTFQVI